MEINVFIEKLAEAIEIENVESLTPETAFRDLEEWSSIAVMMMIAFYYDEFEKEIGGSDIRKCNTIQDLYDLATA